MPAITIAEILAGRSVGDLQTVGQMQVIPIIGEDDDSWAPPDVESSNRSYGSMHVENGADRRTINPPGAGFVTEQKAQDHAIGHGGLVPAKGSKDFSQARCIEQTQPGMIRSEKGIMLILPAKIRSEIIRQHGVKGEYSSMWDSINTMRTGYSTTIGGNSRQRTYSGEGNVSEYLKEAGPELDQFVAEFELVRNQIGAIVLVGGQIIGIEVTPNEAFWGFVWTPLIRVCYGSVALDAQKRATGRPSTHPGLKVTGGGLEDILAALDRSDDAGQETVATVVQSLAPRKLVTEYADRLGEARMLTARDKGLIGQVVLENGVVHYASISAAKA